MPLTKICFILTISTWSSTQPIFTYISQVPWSYNPGTETDYSATQSHACVPSGPKKWKAANDVTTETWQIHHGLGDNDWISSNLDTPKVVQDFITRISSPFINSWLNQASSKAQFCSALSHFRQMSQRALICWGQCVYQKSFIQTTKQMLTCALVKTDKSAVIWDKGLIKRQSDSAHMDPQ